MKHQSSAAAAAVVSIIGLIPVAAFAASTYGGTLDAPRTVSIAQSFTATGHTVKPGYTYRLVFDQLVDDKQPGIECARSIDRPYIVRGLKQPLRFQGRIPTTLACSKDGHRLSRTVKVQRGDYRWVLASKTGRASYDQAASIVVKRVTVK